MEYEDSKNAMYFDPNAYIQIVKPKHNNKDTQKVVFQEPYECLPPRYIDNNFKKHNCNCVKQKKDNCECDCKEKPKEKNPINNGFPFSFDLKKLLPLLSSFGGVNSSSLSNVLSNLGTSNFSNQSFDFSKILSSFLSGGNGLNLFNNLFKKNEKKEHKIESTDIPIKNYTRVE